MSRGRRPRGTPPPKPFDGAWPGINKVEKAVISRVVDVAFTPEQLLRWMYPNHLVDKLQAAFPYTRDLDRGVHIAETLLLPTAFPATSCMFTVRVKGTPMPKHAMLVPEQGNARADASAPGADQITATVQQAHAQHMQFEKVRKVVRWLNVNATIGAARHYCPWLTSILPDDHEFQTATGLIYREPSVSMAPIMDTMRECGAIMAGALLAGDLDHEDAKDIVKLNFRGHNGDLDYVSQPFGLI